MSVIPHCGRASGAFSTTSATGRIPCAAESNFSDPVSGFRTGSGFASSFFEQPVIMAAARITIIKHEIRILDRFFISLLSFLIHKNIF